MPAEVKKEIELEMAHVLFIDIVGYSKVADLRSAGVARDAQSDRSRHRTVPQSRGETGQLIKIPTGDGMALVFYT